MLPRPAVSDDDSSSQESDDGNNNDTEPVVVLDCSDADRLEQGDFCHVRCLHNERWYLARVVKTSEFALYVHYLAWAAKWDVWIDKKTGRFALFAARLPTQKGTLLLQHPNVRETFRAFCRRKQVGVYESDLLTMVAAVDSHDVFFRCGPLVTPSLLLTMRDGDVDPSSSSLTTDITGIGTGTGGPALHDSKRSARAQSAVPMSRVLGAHSIILAVRCNRLLKMAATGRQRKKYKTGVSSTDLRIVTSLADNSLYLDRTTLLIVLGAIYADDLLPVKRCTWAQLVLLAHAGKQLHLTRLCQKALYCFKRTLDPETVLFVLRCTLQFPEVATLRDLCFEFIRRNFKAVTEDVNTRDRLALLPLAVQTSIQELRTQHFSVFLQGVPSGRLRSDMKILFDQITASIVSDQKILCMYMPANSPPHSQKEHQLLIRKHHLVTGEVDFWIRSQVDPHDSKQETEEEEVVLDLGAEGGHTTTATAAAATAGNDEQRHNMFGVHKCLLVARSRFFRALFAAGMKDSGSYMSVSQSPRMTKEALLFLLRYLYYEDTHVPSVEVALDLWKAQSFYMLSGNLLQRCVQKTLKQRVNAENFLRVMHHPKVQIAELQEFISRCFWSWSNVLDVLDDITDLRLLKFVLAAKAKGELLMASRQEQVAAPSLIPPAEVATSRPLQNPPPPLPTATTVTQPQKPFCYRLIDAAREMLGIKRRRLDVLADGKRSSSSVTSSEGEEEEATLDLTHGLLLSPDIAEVLGDVNSEDELDITLVSRDEEECYLASKKLLRSTLGFTWSEAQSDEDSR